MKFEVVVTFPTTNMMGLRRAFERNEFSIYKIDSVSRTIVPSEESEGNIVCLDRQKYIKCIYNGSTIPKEIQVILKKLEGIEGVGISVHQLAYPGATFQ